jgi:hypothetical protein
VFTCYPAIDPSQYYSTTTVVGGISNSNPLLVGVVMDKNAQSVTLLTDDTCSPTISIFLGEDLVERFYVCGARSNVFTPRGCRKQHVHLRT